MPCKTTLAAGVMAAVSVSALLAQSQSTSEPAPKLVYTYRGDPEHRVYEATDEHSSPTTKAVPIPTVMHFCAQHCLAFTLQKDGSLVNESLLMGQRNVRRVFRVVSFTPESVVIDRTDYGDFPGHGTMKGKMQDGRLTAYGEGWAISWGNDLDVLPKSDQDRDMRAGVQPQMSQAQQNMSMAEFLLGLFSGVSSGDTKDSGAGSMIGCAPGYSGCPHIPVKH